MSVVNEKMQNLETIVFLNNAKTYTFDTWYTAYHAALDAGKSGNIAALYAAYATGLLPHLVFENYRG